MHNSTSYPKDKINILLLEGINESAVETFQKAGYTSITRLKSALQGEELNAAVSEHRVLGIRSKTQITKEVIAANPQLLAMACFCIGTNQVDLARANREGLAVFNSPFSNTRSVAELVIGSAIMLNRQIPQKNWDAHQGIWQKSHIKSYELRGKTMAIIGYGRIGSQVSVLAEAMGMHIKYYDIETKLPLGNAQPCDSMSECLSGAHVVSLHVPATEATHYFFTDEVLTSLQEHSVIINMSRGNVIDIDSLKKHLESGHIRGAALDVFPEEPKSMKDAFSSPLQGMSQVILSPHVGGSTEEAQYNIGIDAASKIIRYIETGSSLGSQSIPEISLPQLEGTHRILHIHRNMPGVLSSINSALSEHSINVQGQYLMTNNEIGYVALDVPESSSAETLTALKEIEYTIRARVLF